LGILAWVIYNYIILLWVDYQKKFGNKVVVIVGASSGVGEELALQISEYHPKLVLAARSLDKLEEIKKKCETRGATSVITVKADVTSQDDCKRIIDETIDKFQKLDVLFLNAGIGLSSTLYKMKEPGPLRSVLETDFLGAVNTAFYALPALRTSKGHIVVTSSGYGKLPGLGISAYSASKHALHGFFDCLRAEESRNNIHVTLVCPGYINTPIYDRALGGDGNPVGSVKNNALGGDGKPVAPMKKNAFLTWTETPLRQSVKNILQATAANKTEVYFPFLVNFAVRLRGIIGPSLFDWLVYGSK
jgi:short-subunit dehydrogenase